MPLISRDSLTQLTLDIRGLMDLPKTQTITATATNQLSHMR